MADFVCIFAAFILLQIKCDARNLLYVMCIASHLSDESLFLSTTTFKITLIEIPALSYFGTMTDHYWCPMVSLCAPPEPPSRCTCHCHRCFWEAKFTENTNHPVTLTTSGRCYSACQLDLYSSHVQFWCLLRMLGFNGSHSNNPSMFAGNTGFQKWTICLRLDQKRSRNALLCESGTHYRCFSNEKGLFKSGILRETVTPTMT